MASNHGKFGRVLARDEKGHIGTGLNDLTWGAVSNAVDTSRFEVEIDSVGGGTAGVDTFKWRENGGAWTENVDITGAAQTLDGTVADQALTFAATTGHTLADKWVVGNLSAEPCSIVGLVATITDTAMRLLNPNALPVFTDSGGANVVRIDPSRGTATFDAAPASVTVSGANGYVPSAALFAVGYLYGWKFDAKLDLDDITAFQAKWRSYLAGLAGATGGCDGYFNSAAWFNRMTASAEAYFLAKLFTNDPDADATGDHFIAWVQFTGYNLAANISGVVKDAIGFTVNGAPAFQIAV